MSTDEVGKVNLFSSWYSMLSVVVTLSLTSGGFAIALKEFEKERDQYVSSILSLTSMIAIAVSVVYSIAPQFWNDITGLSTELTILMLVGFLVAPARDFWLSWQRYEYKYRIPGFITCVSAVVASVLSVVVVLNMTKMGSSKIAEGRLFANYSVVFGVAAIIWIYILLKGKTIYNTRYWKFSLNLSLPLVGYSIASQILNTSDRLMISKMIGNSAVGIYSTLYTVSSLSLMVWYALNSSFAPYLYQNIGKECHRIKEISLSILGLYGVMAVLLVFCAPEIVWILATEEYYEAIYIMPPIAAGVFLISIANLYSNILVYLNKTKYIMFSSMVAAVLNIALNALVIPVLGYMAAAYTTMVSYIVMAMLLALNAKKQFNIYNGSLEKVYSNQKIVIMSVTFILISMSGLLVYRYIILRYLCITFIFILGISLLKKYRHNIDAK